MFLTWALLMSIAAVLVILWQQLLSSDSPNWILLLYGWRNYFLIIPLAFVAAACFRPVDVYRLMRHTCLLAIPITALVFFQFLSPATAAVNQGLGTGDNIIANSGVYGGIVRTYGVFTSGPGQNAYIASMIAIILGFWLTSPRKRRVNRIVLILGSVATLTCLALSGSRAAIIWAGIVTVVAAAAGPLAVGAKLRSTLVPIALAIAGVTGAAVAFPVALEALDSRWKAAYADESERFGSSGVLGRGLFDIVSFVYLIPDAPLPGYGMGMGGNAAVRFGKDQLFETAWSQVDEAGARRLTALESDWGRHIVDIGPILGIFFIIFRVCLTAWLGKRAFLAAKRSGSPLPLILFGFVGVLLFNGQITGHGTLNGYAWLFFGFTLALCDKETAERRYSLPRRSLIEAGTAVRGAVLP